MKWTVAPWSTTGHFIYGPNDETIAELDDAHNAHLIAVAPELYEALEELLRVDDDWHGAINSVMSRARGKARSALAKARGEA